jgi:hypothetical protein
MGRTHDLAILSLVRLDLSSTIQGILFSHVTLSDYSRFYRLARSFHSGRPALPTLVRRVTAVLNGGPRNGARLFLARDLIDLCFLCPRLSRITVSEDGHREQLFPDVVDIPRLGALVTIESLTLTNPPNTLGLWLLLLLPKLQALHLFGDIPLSLFNDPPPSSGEGLRHITWGVALLPTLERVKWLFASSTKATGGSLTLVTHPNSPLELERIHEYCQCRGMVLLSFDQASLAIS